MFFLHLLNVSTNIAKFYNMITVANIKFFCIQIWKWLNHPYPKYFTTWHASYRHMGKKYSLKYGWNFARSAWTKWRYFLNEVSTFWREVPKYLKLGIEVYIETYFKIYRLCPYPELKYYFHMERLIKWKKEASVEYK